MESEGATPHPTFGSEILVTIATEKSKFKNYVGLVDTGTSASLIEQARAEQYGPTEVTKKETKWKTQA